MADMESLDRRGIALDALSFREVCGTGAGVQHVDHS
jgi:hypothetical protein